MPTFDASDFDNAVTDDGTAHESTANTDHNDASVLKQGYPYGSFDVITPTPLIAYPFHEDSGSTAYDLAGTNDGTINGATIGAEGLLGTTAYDFDGTDDNVSVPTGWASAPYMVTFWCYPEDGSTDRQIIVDLQNHVSISWNDLNSNGFTVRTFGDNDGGNLSPTGLSLDTWHFAAAYFDPNNQIGLSVNGASFSTTSTSDSDDSTGSYSIGQGAGGENAFDGRIAAVRGYGTILSDAQAASLNDVVDAKGSLTTQFKTV